MLPWHRNVKNFLKYGEWYFVHAWSKTPHIILDNSIKNNKGLLYDNKTSINWFLLRRTTISIVYYVPSHSCPFSITSLWLWQFCIITNQMISEEKKHSNTFKIYGDKKSKRGWYFNCRLILLQMKNSNIQWVIAV